MSPKACKSCGNVLAEGDKHSTCVIHRRCSRAKPCKYDKNELVDYWEGIEAIRTACSRRSERDRGLERVSMKNNNSSDNSARVASDEVTTLDKVDQSLGESDSQSVNQARIINAAQRSEANNSPLDAGGSIRANKAVTLGDLSDDGRNGDGGASPPPISKITNRNIENSAKRTINIGPVGNRVVSTGSHCVQTDVRNATCEPSRHDSAHYTSSNKPIEGESSGNYTAILSPSNMYYAYPSLAGGFGANIV